MKNSLNVGIAYAICACEVARQWQVRSGDASVAGSTPGEVQELGQLLLLLISRGVHQFGGSQSQII